MTIAVLGKPNPMAFKSERNPIANKMPVATPIALDTIPTTAASPASWPMT